MQRNERRVCDLAGAVGIFPTNFGAIPDTCLGRESGPTAKREVNGVAMSILENRSTRSATSGTRSFLVNRGKAIARLDYCEIRNRRGFHG